MFDQILRLGDQQSPPIVINITTNLVIVGSNNTIDLLRCPVEDASSALNTLLKNLNGSRNECEISVTEEEVSARIDVLGGGNVVKVSHWKGWGWMLFAMLRAWLQVHIHPGTKDQAAKDFQQWLAAYAGIAVFTDGSKDDDGNTGCGAVGYVDGEEIFHTHGNLLHAEVYDAEAEGVLRGLRSALRRSNGRSVAICLDNTSVLKTLAGRPAKTSIKTIEAIRRIATDKVSFRWVPGHMGIIGNERADQLAKLGCSGTDYFEPTEAYIRRYARAWLPQAVQGWWEKNASAKYRELGIVFSLKPNPELSLPRWLLGHLLAARTGHGDFAEYHERFNHTDYQADCVCGKTKDTHHIFHCRRVPMWLRVRSSRIKEILATDHKCFARIAEYFFQHCCPRRVAA